MTMACRNLFQHLRNFSAIREAYNADLRPGTDLMYSLVREYYIRTEAYDREVCTGPMDEDRLKRWATDAERRVSDKFEYLVQKEIRLALSIHSISWAEFTHARWAYLRQQTLDVDIGRLYSLSPTIEPPATSTFNPN